MSGLPPPAPPLWAPRLRGLLARFFAWMDARRARDLNRAWAMRQDELWRQAYISWFCEHGWRQGADSPDVAYLKQRASRR